MPVSEFISTTFFWYPSPECTMPSPNPTCPTSSLRRSGGGIGWWSVRKIVHILTTNLVLLFARFCCWVCAPDPFLYGHVARKRAKNSCSSHEHWRRTGACWPGQLDSVCSWHRRETGERSEQCCMYCHGIARRALCGILCCRYQMVWKHRRALIIQKYITTRIYIYIYIYIHIYVYVIEVTLNICLNTSPWVLSTTLIHSQFWVVHMRTLVFVYVCVGVVVPRRMRFRIS